MLNMTPLETDIYDRHLNIVRKSVFSEACASHCISGRYAGAPLRQHFRTIAEKAFPPYGRGFPAMRNTLYGHTKHTVRNAGRALPATPAHPEETAVGMKRTCRTQKDALRKPEWEMPGHNMSARFNLKNQNAKTSCGIPDHTALEANQALCIIRVTYCRNAVFITLLHNA